MVLLYLLCVYSQISTALMYINYTITGSSKDADTTEILSGSNYFPEQKTVYTLNISNTDPQGLIKLVLSQSDQDFIEKHGGMIKWFDGYSPTDSCYILDSHTIHSNGSNVYLIYKTGSYNDKELHEHKNMDIVITFTRQTLNATISNYVGNGGITLTTKTNNITNAKTDAAGQFYWFPYTLSYNLLRVRIGAVLAGLTSSGNYMII